MAEEAKDSPAAVAAVAITEASRVSRDHSSRLHRHQSKVNGHRHRNHLATNSQVHSKDTVVVVAEPNR